MPASLGHSRPALIQFVIIMPTSEPADGITSAASDGTSSRLLNLAPELRNQIYHHVLPQDADLLVGAAAATPGILRTCKIIRREAGGIFCGRNDFHIKLGGHPQDLKCAQDWIADISRYAHHVKFHLIWVGLSNKGMARIHEEVVERARRTRAIVHRPTVAAELAKIDAIFLAAALQQAAAMGKSIGGIVIDSKRESAREPSVRKQQKAYNNAAPPAFWRAWDAATTGPS